MKKRVLIAVLAVFAIILECLPYGTVLNFAGPEYQISYTYSYFDPTPFGYANFGPLLTATMTCVLLILSIIYLFAGKQGLKTSITVISGIALSFSLMPLMFGLSFFSVVGASISVVIAVIFALSLTKASK